MGEGLPARLEAWEEGDTVVRADPVRVVACPGTGVLLMLSSGGPVSLLLILHQACAFSEAEAWPVVSRIQSPEEVAQIPGSLLVASSAFFTPCWGSKRLPPRAGENLRLRNPQLPALLRGSRDVPLMGWL